MAEEISSVAIDHAADQEALDIAADKTERTFEVRSEKGAWVNLSLDELIFLLKVDQTAYIEAEGKKLAEEINGIAAKIKMLDKLYKDVLELSDKNGSIDWEKKGLGPSIEALRKEGFIIPAKKGVLPREERDALLRSLTQQRDDMSTEAHQLNLKLNRHYSVRDDLFRFISSFISSSGDSCKKIARNIG
jgi:hypothetical protein